MTTAPPTDDERTVATPGSTSPQRPSRRARRQRRQRRQRLVQRLTILGTAVSVLVVVIAVAFAIGAAITDDEEADDPLAGTDEGIADARGGAPADGVVLLAQQGADGAAVSLTLLTAEHLVLVPPGVMTEVPSFGLDAVGTSLGLGGPALLQATVENLFGVTVDHVVLVDDAALASLLGPAGDLTVDVPERVEEVGPRGAVRVLWDAGPTLIGPGDAGRLLAAEGETNDLGRLARHQAFWESWLAALEDDPAAVPEGELAPYLASLADDATIELLPVETVDAGASGAELYRVRETELDALVRRALPGAPLLDRTSRARVQILNGTGAVGLAQEVTLRLVQPPLRARVLYTGNADSFDHAETQIVIYDRAHQAMAESVRTALGAGRVVLSRRPLGIVDVTIVVGKDFG